MVQAHFRCASNAWHPTDNPEGCINLGTAENHLVYDLLEPHLNGRHNFTEAHTHYGPMYGLEPFRQALSAYLGNLTRTEMPADRLAVASGSSAIIDMLMFAMCEPGDGVIIPAPYYAGFDHDLKGRCQVEPIPAHLDPEAGFALTRKSLQEAILQAGKRGIRTRALLLTSPNNPLGRVYDRETLEMVIAFVKEHKIELISDELYANSIFGESEFISMAKLAPEAGMGIHYVYGFAKDFGLSGFKAGVLYSTNDNIHAAVKELCYFAPVSNAAQHILVNLLTNNGFLDGFFPENRKRLKSAWECLHGLLDAKGIPHVIPEAGFFAWLDLSEWIEHPDTASEMKLYHLLNAQAGVNLSPGSVFHSPEPGWFRLCYARPNHMLEIAVERISNCLDGLKLP